MCVNGHWGAPLPKTYTVQDHVFQTGQNQFRGYKSEESRRVLVVRVNSEGKYCFMELLFHLHVYMCTGLQF